jgi:anhydro-N-acetylmuramic acid kinase
MRGKTKHSSLCALGMMSGTSLDGIDIAQITTDGERILDFGPTLTIPYADTLREYLMSVLGQSDNLIVAEKLVTDAHISAIKTFLKVKQVPIRNINVIGFHGQTIIHAPELCKTLQIGDAQRLASEFNINVVADFRSNDVANGGEGAPLAPVFHRALAKTFLHPISILNIGGVANLSWIHGKLLMAFDTGPGNALLDDWVFEKTGRKMDHDGELARSGTVSEIALQKLMANPFFKLPAPKSLDRNYFREVSIEALAELNTEDGAATLTAFTSAAVAIASKQLPRQPHKWLVSGGGRKNKTLMDCLQKVLVVPVRPVESVGWSGDALEAQLMGFLAVRSLNGFPLSYPLTTGVPSPTKGGVFFPSDNPIGR